MTYLVIRMNMLEIVLCICIAYIINFWPDSLLNTLILMLEH